MTSDERRRYFRVSDLVGLRYKMLSEGERDLAVLSQPTSLKSLLGQLESDITRHLMTIQLGQPEVHQVLELMNQKINLAFGHGFSTMDEVSEEATVASQVNLSACGLAFASPESAALNQYLSIELTLYPKNIRLQLLAAVISSDTYHEGEIANRHLIRADFVDISDADQEILVQHVIQRQVQQIKDSKEGS